MAKFTRNQLKDLVKECLVEILTEGLAEGSPAAAEMIKESLQTPRPRRTPSPRKPRTMARNSAARNPALDSISYGQLPNPQKRVDEAVKNNVAMITSDPIMSDIFADTAATTLQEQLAEESRSSRASGHSAPIDTTEKIGDPGEIFSQSSQNWAMLAFSDAPKK